MKINRERGNDGKRQMSGSVGGGWWGVCQLREAYLVANYH